MKAEYLDKCNDAAALVRRFERAEKAIEHVFSDEYPQQFIYELTVFNRTVRPETIQKIKEMIRGEVALGLKEAQAQLEAL